MVCTSLAGVGAGGKLACACACVAGVGGVHVCSRSRCWWKACVCLCVAGVGAGGKLACACACVAGVGAGGKLVYVCVSQESVLVESLHVVVRV